VVSGQIYGRGVPRRNVESSVASVRTTEWRLCSATAPRPPNANEAAIEVINQQVLGAWHGEHEGRLPGEGDLGAHARERE
jgi:hypothetical protein